MQQSLGNMSRLIFQFLLVIIMTGILVSACSFPGSSSKTSVTPTATPTRTSSDPNRPQGPLQSLFSGRPLSSQELQSVKPLIFNLDYATTMSQDILKMYTPGSPSFHRFLTHQQIVQHYALPDTQLNEVRNWLTSHRYTINAVDALRSAIHVQAKTKDIETSLNITFKAYDFPPLQRSFYMQEGNPRNPVHVTSIVGLNNFALPKITPPSGAGFSVQAQQATGDCHQYGAKSKHTNELTLTRDRLAAAYHIDQLYSQGLRGQGMTIGVAEFGDTYDPQDIANYAACAGIPTPTIQNITVGHPPSGQPQGEATLDLELIAGLAPGAQILDYQTGLDDAVNGTSFAQAMLDVFNQVALDQKVQVLSVSYGAGESAFSTNEQAAVSRSLAILAAEGISVFISSGDCGPYSLRLPNVADTSFPASSPYAIAVGGTHLQVGNNNQRTASETAWGNDTGGNIFLPCQNDWGSGGGVSQNSIDFMKPSWQQGKGTTTNYGSLPGVITVSTAPLHVPNGLRQVPDVAADAFPNISIYVTKKWVAAGGTSAAAPMWAAGALLVDQGLKQQGKSPLGGVPEMYTLASHASAAYTDITHGNGLLYRATPGWDYMTGWGSPNFNAILQFEEK